MAAEGGRVQISFPQHAAALLDSLNLLRLEGKFCDVTIHVGGRTFLAHKSVLAAASPFFHDKLLLQDGGRLLLPPAIDPDAFEGLLHLIYSGRLTLLLEALPGHLLVASGLQMWHVVDQCSEILKELEGGGCRWAGRGGEVTSSSGGRGGEASASSWTTRGGDGASSSSSSWTTHGGDGASSSWTTRGGDGPSCPTRGGDGGSSWTTRGDGASHPTRGGDGASWTTRGGDGSLSCPTRGGDGPSWTTRGGDGGSSLTTRGGDGPSWTTRGGDGSSCSTRGGDGASSWSSRGGDGSSSSSWPVRGGDGSLWATRGGAVPPFTKEGGEEVLKIRVAADVAPSAPSSLSSLLKATGEEVLKICVEDEEEEEEEEEEEGDHRRRSDALQIVLEEEEEEEDGVPGEPPKIFYIKQEVGDATTVEGLLPTTEPGCGELSYVLPASGGTVVATTSMVTTGGATTFPQPSWKPVDLHGNEILGRGQALHAPVKLGAAPDGKRFGCLCGKRFAVKPKRDRHIMLTLSLRPFSCSSCHKRFKLKHHLTEHMKTHEGAGRACERCGRRFRLRSGLAKHRPLCPGLRWAGTCWAWE
ncbi:LOW QUALITY PROTEIN: zinc finger and BTB domain-containing protein 9 [Aegotheles albertisi]